VDDGRNDTAEDQWHTKCALFSGGPGAYGVRAVGVYTQFGDSRGMAFPNMKKKERKKERKKAQAD
jgi:hypothetical protein